MSTSNLQFYSLNISSPQGPVLPQSLLSDNDASSADIYYLQAVPVKDAPNIIASLESHHFFTRQITICWPRDDGNPDRYTTMQSFLAFRTQRFTESRIPLVIFGPRIHWSYQVIDNNTQQTITISHLQIPSQINSSKQARFTLNVEIEAPVNDVSRNNFSIETVDNQPEKPVLNLDAPRNSLSLGTRILQWIDSIFRRTFSISVFLSTDSSSANGPLMIDITFEETPSLISRISESISGFFCRNDQAAVSN